MVDSPAVGPSLGQPVGTAVGITVARNTGVGAIDGAAWISNSKGKYAKQTKIILLASLQGATMQPVSGHNNKMLNSDPR